VDSEEPGGKEVEEVVEAVGVCDAVDGCVQRREEREDIRDVLCILPVLMTSTTSTNGRTASRLWCVLKGVNQWTARLWIQTISTGMLIGRTQSMRISIEVV
jgi:hypothetical protein